MEKRTGARKTLSGVAHAALMWWAAPNSIIGHLLGWYAAGRRAKLADAITEYYDNPILDWLRISAITFGNTINHAPGVDPETPCLRYDCACNVTSLRAHECAHVRQYRLWGPFFIPAYLIAEAWARTFGSGINWFENAADDACTETREENEI